MAMLNSGVYKIQNKNDGKMYIGSSKNIKIRINQHINKLIKNKNENQRLQNAWNKYGAEIFEFSTILICAEKDLIMYEQKIIDLYNVVNDGYNIQPIAGRISGKNPSIETRKKLSDAAKKRRFSEETKSKISLSLINRKLPPVSNETRKKLSEKTKLSWVIRREKGLVNKYRSPESIRKQVDTRAKRKLENYYIPYKVSEETKQKMRNYHLNKKLLKEKGNQ